MNWLRTYMQAWVGRKAQEIQQVNKVNKEYKGVLDDLESAKTIGELRAKTEKYQKLGIITQDRNKNDDLVSVGKRRGRTNG